MTLTNNGLIVIANRAFKASPDYATPTQFQLGIGTTSSAETDSSIETSIPVENVEAVDSCDATTGWSANGSNSVSSNTSIYREGSGALNLVKSDTSSVLVSAEKNVTNRDFSSKTVWVMAYFSVAVLAELDSSSALELRYGNDSSNYYYKTFGSASLVSGWNYLSFSSSSATGSTGTPTTANCDYFQVILKTGDATDVFSAGGFVFDNLFLAETTDYFKDFDSVASLDENTNEVTVECVVTVNDSEGFDISEFGLVNEDSSRKLLTHDVFAAITKTGSNQLNFFTKFSFDQTC